MQVLTSCEFWYVGNFGLWVIDMLLVTPLVNVLFVTGYLLAIHSQSWLICLISEFSNAALFIVWILIMPVLFSLGRQISKKHNNIRYIILLSLYVWVSRRCNLNFVFVEMLGILISSFWSTLGGSYTFHKALIDMCNWQPSAVVWRVPVSTVESSSPELETTQTLINDPNDPDCLSL